MNEEIKKFKEIKRVKQIKSVTIEQAPIHLEFRKSGQMMIEIYPYQIKLRILFYEMKLIRNQVIKMYRFTGFKLIAFSQISNWFVSVNENKQVQFWKQQMEGNWVGQLRMKQPIQSISCIILNRKEDTCITGSYGKGITVWEVRSQENEIVFHYEIDLEFGFIRSMKLNQSETKLVICMFTDIMILLGKGQDEKWKHLIHFQHENEHSEFFFFSDHQIAGIQSSKYDIIDIFEIVNDKIIKKPEEQLKEVHESHYFVPTVINQKKQTFLRSNDKLIYFLKKQQNGRLERISDFIQIQQKILKANLTKNGELLNILTSMQNNYMNKQSQIMVYKIQHQ